MTNDNINRRSRATVASDVSCVRELAEAGARGRRLTQAETIAVCEALRARSARSPNRFHSSV